MVDVKSLTRPPFLIKLVELVLGAVCMGLISGQIVAWGDMEKTEVVHATYFGFFIVTCIVVLSYVLDSPINGKLMMVIAAAGAVLYFTAGALNLELCDKATWKNDRILAAGILGLINGVVHAVDVFLSWRG